MVGLHLLQRREDIRSEDVPSRDGEPARDVVGVGLLDDLGHVHRLRSGPDRHDPVPSDEVVWHFGHGDRGARPRLLVRRRESADDPGPPRGRGIDDRVAQRDCHRVAAGEASRVAHRVAQPQWPRLARIQDLEPGVGVEIEMVLDRLLARRRDEQRGPHPVTRELLDHVLHHRAVDDRQHLLRDRPAGRQQASPLARYRNHCACDQATSRAAPGVGERSRAER